MKKVLALVLAVIMVCTMALAATTTVINLNPTTPPTDPSTAPEYEVLTPGQTIAINLNDTKGDPINDWYFKDGEFVPANNVLTVTFAKGADLVKSQGWVKLGSNNYQYQITLKEDLTKVADKKVADLQISAITVKSTGYNAVTIFKAAKAEEYISYAVGYNTTTLDLVEKGSFAPVENTINVVNSVKDSKGKEVSALEVTTADGLTYTMTKGLKFYAMDAAPTFEAKDLNNGTVSYDKLFANPLNVAAKVSYAKGVAADKAYNVYAKTADGKILAVNATTTDGVMSFTVPAMSTVILTEGSLTTTGTTGTNPGTTTNPGTGANDVVGVAAALAVVALVSGAAISLKK